MAKRGETLPSTPAWRSLATTESGHLRPQTKKQDLGHLWHKVGSLTTTKRLIRWQGPKPPQCAVLWPHLYPCTGWVGWVGWDDNVPCTCTHTSRTHHLYPYARWVGWLGWVGWVGWYRSETKPTFPSISKNPTGQQFQGQRFSLTFQRRFIFQLFWQTRLMGKDGLFSLFICTPFFHLFSPVSTSLLYSRSLGHNLVVFYGSPIHGKKQPFHGKKHPFHGNKQGFHGLSTVPLGCEHMKHLRVWPTGRF